MTDVVGASEEEISRETITPTVMEALRDHVSVDRRARKTHLDQWIGFLCFIFDLNYRESIQIVKEQGYYRKPFERTDFKNPAARALVHEALGTVDLYMETFGQTIPDALREFFQDHPKMALAFPAGLTPPISYTRPGPAAVMSGLIMQLPPSSRPLNWRTQKNWPFP